MTMLTWYLASSYLALFSTAHTYTKSLVCRANNYVCASKNCVQVLTISKLTAWPWGKGIHITEQYICK